MSASNDAKNKQAELEPEQQAMQERLINTKDNYNNNHHNNTLTLQQERSLSKQIDSKLKQSKSGEKKKMKLLLLGAASTGKSTFLKQMILLYGDGFNLEYRKSFIYHIHQNIIQTLETLLEHTVWKNNSSLSINQAIIPTESNEHKAYPYQGPTAGHPNRISISSDSLAFTENILFQPDYYQNNMNNYQQSHDYHNNNINHHTNNNNNHNNNKDNNNNHYTNHDHINKGNNNIKNDQSDPNHNDDDKDNNNEVKKDELNYNSISESLIEKSVSLSLFDNALNSRLVFKKASGSNLNSPSSNRSSKSGSGSNSGLGSSDLRSDRKNLIDTALSWHINALWRDYRVQKTFQKIQHSLLLESGAYFLNKVLEICNENYIPSNSDILHCRVQTNGIIEAKFTFDEIPFSIFDVGGQRSNRKKWIHCFENVNCVLFLASLTEYNQTVEEDHSPEPTNRLIESALLFESIANNKFLSNASLVLFLNKVDLLESKLKEYPLSDYFDSYHGRNNVLDATTWIKSLFKARKTDNRKLFVHVTSATDSRNIERVFIAVKEHIFYQRLKHHNLT